MADEKKKRMTGKEVRKQLEDLVKLFQKLPKSSKFKTLASEFQKAVKVSNEIKKEFQKPKKQESIQDTIDYLRVCIKYTLLDVDSLRRESEYLRKLLKERGQ